MAKASSASAVFIFVLLLLVIHSYQLQSSQVQVLLRIRRLLGHPAVLSSWSYRTDFCNSDPSPSVTVVCYEDTITQLHIIGKVRSPLPQNFSIHSFFTTLVKLPNLKVLSLVSLGLWGPLPSKIARLASLEIFNVTSNFFYGVIPPEIGSLSSLQTLILDNNMFSGEIPAWMADLPVLSVLSLKNNSFNGSLPNSLGALENLRVIALSNNQFSGEVPDISSLTNLQVLDLENNNFGPQFPALGSKMVTLLLRKNRFSSGIPSHMSSSYQLRKLDISFNRFMGPFPPWLLSLPSIHYLNVAGNRLTGMLFKNMSCNTQLEFVDLSANLLSGSLPTCLQSNANSRVVEYSRNCLMNSSQNQHPHWFCQNQALAVGIVHDKQKVVPTKKAVVSSIVAGVVGGIALVSFLLFLIWRRMKKRNTIRSAPTRLNTKNPSNGIPSKLLSDARYASKTAKLGALGLPSYRPFSLEELEEATNDFHTSTFLGEGSFGQMYKGRLSNGSLVAIRCLKLKRRHTTQDFVHHIELVSKLRHPQLVSALGHCFEYYLEDSSVSRIFIVFEYVSNGTLRSRISGSAKRRLSWTQRISAAIGIAKGIHYLHTGIVPGIFGHKLSSTSVLLDQNYLAKICSYNLPVLAENTSVQVGTSVPNASKEICVPQRTQQDAKIDVYDFGVLLLEIITGRLINSQSDVNAIKCQLQSSATADEVARKSSVDPAVATACLDESLKTVMDVCLRCLSEEPKERPSVEDVLWNLQFAAQVQEAWKGESQGSEGSPISSS